MQRIRPHRLHRLQRSVHLNAQRSPVRQTVSTDTQTESSRLSAEKDSAEYLKGIIDSVFDEATLEWSMKQSRTRGEVEPIDFSDTLDLELYAIVSMFLRDFVCGWYEGRLQLAHREQFLGEILYVCQRLIGKWKQGSREVDWTSVVLDDLFEILSRHVQALQEARAVQGTRFGRGDFVENYMRINGHFSMDSPEKEKLYARVLSRRILEQCVPKEETGSRLARDFVTDLLCDLVIKNVMVNLPQNYALWDIIGGVSKAVNTSTKKAKPTVSSQKQTLVSKITDLGAKLSHFVAYSTSLLGYSPARDLDNNISCFSVFKFANRTLLLDSKYPLLVVFARKLAYVLCMSQKVSHWANNLANNLMYGAVLTKSNLSKAARSLRHLMFPNDEHFHMKPRYIPETAEDLERLRLVNKEKIRDLADAKGAKILGFFYKDGDQVDEAIDNLLETFRYKEINRSLLWQILDLVVSEVFPELVATIDAESTPHTSQHEEGADDSFEESEVEKVTA